MKKVTILILAATLFLVGCVSKDVKVEKFNGIFPGMSCSELDSYLNKNNIPFKKDKDGYEFCLKDEAWETAHVTCNGTVTEMEFVSMKGSSPKNAQMYIDMQQSLLNAFRDNQIMYEEGNKIINLSNGIKIHQFVDAKSGVITGFKISVEAGPDSKLAWQTAAPLLLKVGDGK